MIFMNEETQETFEEHIYEEVILSGSVNGQIPNARSENFLSSQSFLEKTIVGILLGLVFLLPIFFMPIEGIFSGFSKNMLLSSAVILTLLLTFLLWMKQETLVLPKSPLFGALLALVIIYSFSSLLSGSFSNSFFGTGAETTASFELLLASLSLFLFAIFFRTKERLFYAFAAVFFSSFLVFLFQIFHFIFPHLSAFPGLSASKTANLVGDWSDFGVFSGITAILTLIALEKFLHGDKTARKILYSFLFVSIFFYSTAFFSGSWIILGLAALTLSVSVFFKYAAHVPTGNVSAVKKWLVSVSFAVAAFSFLFAFIGPYVNGKVFELLNIPPVQDVRPSLEGTYQTFRGMFADNKKGVFFGAGPNRFFIPWQKYRPKEVNYTPWWGVDFNEGIGTVPSAAVSSGVLGFLAWVVFLGLFFFGGMGALSKSMGQMDAFMRYAAAASYAAASYCWVALFLDTAGTVPFAFAFIFTGLFLGALSASGLPQVREYKYTENPQAGFAATIILLLLLCLTVFLGYRAIEKTRAFFTYRDAVIAGANGDFEKSEVGFAKAVRVFPSDAYYRSFSVFRSFLAERLISRTDLSPDELRAQFGANFRASVENADMAIELDAANYQNWLVLGNAHALLVPLQIEKISEGAYAAAQNAYGEAAKRNPFNPQILHMSAQLAVLYNRPDEAIRYEKKALNLKNDYVDALILVSQIEDDRGRLKEAIAAMKSASVGSVPDPGVLFRLGYLRYKNGDYEEAVSVLEKATQIIPNYANAKYFLGLSYFEFGRTTDALKEFADIERLNPDRTDIGQIVDRLQNGYAPLSAPIPKETPALFIDPASTTEKAKPPRKER
jgi:tetratricopeptide (TPR) repeat protein